MMTGSDVTSLRSSLGLKPNAFAAILGVHPSSLYRWESACGEEVLVDPLQVHLLVSLHDVVKKRSSGAQKELGQQLFRALILKGALFALFTLLKVVFEV